MSVGRGIIEHMFEGLSDGDLIDVMGAASREESAAISKRLTAVAELFVRREGELSETAWWAADYCAAVAAEVAAAQNISQARAVGQVQFACALRDQLPAVAALFASGGIDFRLVAMIVCRTENVDRELMPQLDKAIAARAQNWMRLSKPKLRDRIDLFVAKFDPAGVRVPPMWGGGRHLDVDPTCPGMAGIAGSVHAADGAALDQRLDALADTVCPNDPRTKAQRRADACGPLARGEDVLACQCGSDQCPAKAQRASTAAAVIHVLAEQSTLDGGPTPGYLSGFGVLPAQAVRELAVTAKLTPVTLPMGAPPEPGYRPSAALARFLRCRDLTCRFPGCDRPVEHCDLDHTVPWPSGATHASDLKHYCRIHHLIKTFYAGLGWHDEQRPDGTIVLRSPSGHLYTTTPHGAALFPVLGQPTGELTNAAAADLSPQRGAMMPRRKQTREQDRQYRINGERRQRAEHIAHKERARQAWLAKNYEPPPF